MTRREYQHEAIKAYAAFEAAERARERTGASIRTVPSKVVLGQRLARGVAIRRAIAAFWRGHPGERRLPEWVDLDVHTRVYLSSIRVMSSYGHDEFESACRREREPPGRSDWDWEPSKASLRLNPLRLP